VGDNGNKVLIPGFYDNIVPLTPAEEALFKTAAKTADLKQMAQNIGVARFISNNPYEVLKASQYGTSFNLDGMWSGNMFPGGSGAILPNTITSKHNIRYVPNMSGPDIVKKLRAYLDKEGFPPIETKGFTEQKASSVSLPGDVSSQYISALMMTAPLLPQPAATNRSGSGTWRRER